MKLRNKETGEIVVFGEGIVDLTKIDCKNVAEMIEAGWEDYDETKEHWYINEFGTPEMAGYFNRENIYDKMRKLVGNDFGTKEEAEKAVEKLKAWKRLKDKGFKLINYNCPLRKLYFEVDGEKFFEASGEVSEETRKDLTLLFVGEE